MTKLKHIGKNPYRFGDKNGVRVLRRGDIIDVDLRHISYSLLRLFKNLETETRESEKRDKKIAKMFEKLEKEKKSGGNNL